jgi:hypothetical protein
MIVPKEKISIETSSKLKVSEAKIVASAHIMRVLRDGIYTDKILACIREPIMNALDSHVEAGVDREVEVVLPTFLNPTFIVRDFGIGLDDYGVREILFSYGDPTGANIKEKSNHYLGSFHIGAKSPWSYTSSFQVTAIKDGVKRIYNAYINEREIGDVALIHEEQTDSSNGVEVAVPVHVSDIGAFRIKLAQLLRFSTRKIKVIGDYIPIVDKWVIKTDKWGIIRNDSSYIRNSPSYVVMGGVSYTLQPDNIKNLEHLELGLLHRGVVIFAEIGDVTISASRENVSYTETTNSFIKRILSGLEKEIGDIISQSFVNVKTLYEAHEQYYALFATEGRLGNSLKSYIPENWNANISINGSSWAIQTWIMHHSEILFSWKVGRNTYGGKRYSIERNQNCIDLFLYKKIYIVFEDSNLKNPTVKRRVYEDLRTNDSSLAQVIFLKTAASKDILINHFGIPSSVEFIDVSTLKGPTRVSSGIRNCFSTRVVSAYSNSKFSFTDLDIDVKNTSGHYIYRKRDCLFLSPDSEEISYSFIQLNDFLAEETDFKDKIYSFTPCQAKRLNPKKWTPLRTFILPNLIKYNVKSAANLPPIFNCALSNIILWNDKNNYFGKNHFISKLGRLYSREASNNKYILLSKVLIPNYDNSKKDHFAKIEATIKSFYEKYKLLTFVDLKSPNLDAVIEYIQMVDSKRKSKTVEIPYPDLSLAE